MSPQDAEGLAHLPPPVPTLSIALTIPLPVAWPRRIHGREVRLPDEVALTCIEFAFGEGRGHAVASRPARRPRRRRAASVPQPVEPGALAAPSPSFATAMREGAWWQLALGRLRQRTRRLHMLRLLPL